MKGVPVSPRRVFGVHFNSARDAGRAIRVCRAHPGEEGVRVESVDALADLPGGAVERAGALRALVEKVAGAPRSAWGLDFPFALPSAAFPDAPDWRSRLDLLARLEGPEGVAEACREAAGRRAGGATDAADRGPGAGPRRPTDEEAGAPSPCEPGRIESAYHGMVGVLQPLSGRKGVAILPLDPLPAPPPKDSGGRPCHDRRASAARLPHIYVMEVYPAALLRELGVEPDREAARGAEGDRARSRAAGDDGERELLLRRVIDAGMVRPMSRGLRQRVVEDPAGGGLAAVLAAVAAWRGTRCHDHGEIRADPRYATEGYVYR